MADKDPWVWLEGDWVRWSEANLHVSTHAFLYGTGVFEGIRAYWQEPQEQLAVWMLQEHADRLARNARMMGFDDPPSGEAVAQRALELLGKNEYTEDVYIRPIVYLGHGTVRVRPKDTRAHFLVFGFPLKKYFEADGLSVAVSSWVRPPSSTMPPMGKVNGAYANSFLASMEAVRAGYDEAIMLNHRGLVSEGPAENLFLVRDGKLVTPPLSADILDGVTRAHIRALAEDLGIPYEERDIPRVELYAADEMFFCGTGVEVEPITRVDGRPVGTGEPGPIAVKLRDALQDSVRGRNAKYADRLTVV